MSTSLGNVSSQPYWLKTPDNFMVQHLRQQHNEAIYAYGEYSMFVLLWGVDDLEAGLCQRCPYCMSNDDVVEQAVAAAYLQPTLDKCPQCYGTTFFSMSAVRMGGLKARIVRPCMWSTTDIDRQQKREGQIASSTAQVQSISDFRLRSGDYVFRADQTRWRIQTVNTDIVVSGLQATDDRRAMVGYSYPDAKQEDPTMPVYIIPPSPSTVATILDVPLQINYPIDFSEWELVNGPLIADDFTN